MNPFAGVFRVSQTWAQHIENAGATLGGVDYAGRIGTGQTEMPRGTPLTAGAAGVFEWVTAATLNKPAWYNVGLGYAAAVIYPNGCRTIYGHCSARSADPGAAVTAGQLIAYSGGQKGTVGAGKSTGGHVHCHDIEDDGTTRARPFTLAPAGGGGGGGLPTRKRNKDMPYTMKRAGDGPEWSRIHPAFRGPSELERGYVLTGNATRAKWWAREDADGQGTEDVFERDEYVEGQAIARQDHEAWVAGGGAVIDFPPGLATKADVDNAADRVITEVHAVPEATADEAAERLQE